MLDKLVDFVISDNSQTILKVIAVLAVILMMFLVAKDAADRIMKKKQSKKAFPVLDGILVIVCAVVIAESVAMLLTLLQQKDVSTTVLLLCLIVPFVLAGKSQISNITGGFNILASDWFKYGSYITVGDQSGYVRAFNLVETTLEAEDGTKVRIPNSKFTENEIAVYEADTPYRVNAAVLVPTGADQTLAREILLKTAEGLPGLLPDREVAVGIDSFDGYGSAVYDCRLWCKFTDRYDVKYAYMEKASASLQEAGVMEKSQ